MLFSPIQRMSSMQQLYLASNKNVMGTEMSKKCIYWQRLNYCPRPSREIAKRLIAPIKCILPTPNVVRKYLHTRDDHYVSNYRISIPSAACHTKKRLCVFERIATLVDIVQLHAAFVDNDIRITVQDASTVLISTTADFLPPCCKSV